MMNDYETILREKIAYYGETEAAYEFAAEKYATIKMIEENQSILEMAKIHMDERACMVLQNRINELYKMILPITK